MNVLPAILLGYAIGSIPIGFLVAQGTRGVDLRRAGSGNVGAANAYRTAGLGLAIAVMAADMTKGAVAVLLAGGGAAAVPAGVAAALLIVFRHRGNIARLWSRTERVMGT